MEALMMTLSSGAVSGIRPYFMLLLLGLSGRFFELDIVPQVLQRTDVLIIAGVLVVVDFAADKIPFLDSFWDAIHTIVRPVAGGAIGYLLGGETDTANAIVLAAVGAFSAFGVHTAKATTRAAVNASPEPFSNALVSFGEDAVALVLGLMAVLLPILAGLIALAVLAGAIIGTVLLVRLIRKWRSKQTATIPAATVTHPGV